MKEFMLSGDVIKQIKDFKHRRLTNKQSLLIDKLILNEELKKRYKRNGLCKDCKQPKITFAWCQCKFQQNFKNWTSGNNEIDKLIQKAQLKANRYEKILEWIEYDRFENVEYLAKGGFGTIYKAIWKDGYIEEWDFENNKWRRSKYWAEDYENFPVVLKCLHNSQDVTVDFLREIELHTTISSDKVTFCYGITKDPESNNFMMGEKLNSLQRIANGLEDIHSQGLIHHNIHCAKELHNSLFELYYSSKNYKSDQEINKQIEEADKINEKFTSSSLPYNGTTLSYTTNPQAVYTSRLLIFKDLPEPKNAVDDKDDDNSFKYSEAIDFTKLNLDKNS
ncbi:uncharacterized protein OCT59_024273 [Rhizophagus irregularis]|uniref:uncharacterized protein n=1 Tax=Rhizophagus irregularis TaxID=588596 RepID=UPI003320BAF9|nr:hypothetical protein OCT59_024273 [Rhizophagus irregularis]